MGTAWERLIHLIVVCDAGPLIHLDEVGCLDLLAEGSVQERTSLPS
jgi:hypothetical protein